MVEFDRLLESIGPYYVIRIHHIVSYSVSATHGDAFHRY